MYCENPYIFLTFNLRPDLRTNSLLFLSFETIMGYISRFLNSLLLGETQKLRFVFVCSLQLRNFYCMYNCVYEQLNMHISLLVLIMMFSSRSLGTTVHQLIFCYCWFCWCCWSSLVLVFLFCFFWITDGLIQGMMVESQKSRSQPAPPTRPLYLSSLCNITVNALHVCQRHLWLEFGNCITREERPAVGRRPIEMRRRSLWPMAGRHWSCHQWRARECSEGWGWRRSRWRP